MSELETIGSTVESLHNRALERIGERLEDPDLPAHVLSKLFSDLTRQKARDAGEADGELPLPGGPEFGPAFAALPTEHATALLVAEIRRLEEAAGAYRGHLVALIGVAAAQEALD